MVELTLEGECHNGTRPKRSDAWSWRFEARGDDGHYCYYFHATLHASASGVANVYILPDSDLLPDSAGSFERHLPNHIWIRRDGEWEIRQVAQTHSNSLLHLQIPMQEGETVSFSRMRPYPYSKVIKRARELAERAQVDSLGVSAEGRDIPALAIGTGKTRILILGGQHPAEFSGTEAVFGIADWLLTNLPEAQSIREKYTLCLIPLLNPDGNVAGRCGRNAQGVDLYRAFEGAASGELPSAAEAVCLWKRVEALQPILSLNFHTFPQPALSGSSPYEGLYTPPDEAFLDTNARARQRLLNSRMAWDTNGLSQYGAFSEHIPSALEWQLALRGVPSVFYELQDTMGAHWQRRAGVQVLRAALIV
jgi:hypothetical protein